MKRVIAGILILFLISLVSAISVSSTESSIMWNYSDENNIQAVIVDGQIVNANLSTKYYILSNLETNETHRLDLITSEGIKTAEGTTLKTKWEITLEVYFFFIAAAVFLFISYFVRIASVLALMFSIIGVIQTVSNDFTLGLIFVTMTLVSIASLGYDR